MFKFLKEKLSIWTEKIKSEFSEQPKSEEKSSKKKVKSSKSTKVSKIEKKSKKTKESKVLQVEEVKPAVEENKLVEKKGFLSRIFSSENKTSELIVEDIKKEGTEIKSPEARYESESSLGKERIENQEKESKSLFDMFKKKMTPEKFEELFQELETMLLQNNVAYEAVQEIKKQLSVELINKNVSDINLEEKLKTVLLSLLIEPQDFIKQVKQKKPFVIVFVGINGSGKTTTIAKVANLLKKQKLKVCIAAADTYRAAAVEQLETHAKKLEIPIIKKDYGSDPASVGFDAIAYAKKNNIDVVLIDTAGRMNTKESLMKEMEKIMKVCHPDMKIFLGESITGNDATEQAKAFNDYINIDGIILSKADVDEKGGTALSVSFITKKPILFLGTGQSYEDLQVFDKQKMVNNLGL